MNPSTLDHDHQNPESKDIKIVGVQAAKKRGKTQPVAVKEGDIQRWLKKLDVRRYDEMILKAKLNQISDFTKVGKIFCDGFRLNFMLDEPSEYKGLTKVIDSSPFIKHTMWSGMSSAPTVWITLAENDKLID